MSNKGPSQPIKTELSRDLGLYSALAIGVGTMIAAGIFTLSGLAIRNVGSAAILSFLLAALVSILTALTYCEFVSIYPRSGEGYLYARKTFTPPLAYLVGWALFLGYTASCAFYIASLSTYFVEFVYHTPYQSAVGIVVLIILTMLNIKGTKESGGFQVVVTVAKVLLLLWFIAGGLSYVDMDEIIEKFSTDPVAIVSTSALVFITFFGFSAIAASAGEIRKPLHNIPKAIFWSVGVVTVLYTLVVIVTIAAGLSEYTEAAMGAAAKQFLGGVGGMVIVGGAIFSMISASNASIMAGSRVALSMSDLGHLPRELGSINQTTRTPIMSLLIVGGTIALFSMSLPLEDLAHFADTVLLIALIFVNAALIVHRKKYPKQRRPFKVPFVPWLPGIAIIANSYLLLQIMAHPLPVIMALVCLLLGMLGFLTWKGAQPVDVVLPGEASMTVLETFSPPKNDKRPHIMVPLANPRSIPALIRIAVQVAKEQGGILILLRVTAVPEQMPLSFNVSNDDDRAILDLGQKEVEKYGMEANALLKVSHNAARAILETARERNCGLIVLGWKGFSSSRDKIMGQVVDTVVTYAQCDLMLVKLSRQSPVIKDILLPTAGGEHARAAEMYAATLVKAAGGTLSICRVDDGGRKSKEVTEDGIHQAQKRIKEFNGLDTGREILAESSIAKGILNASKNYDTIVIGATRTSIYQQILFGSIPENVARSSDKNIIMIKHHHPVKALIGRVLGE